MTPGPSTTAPTAPTAVGSAELASRLRVAGWRFARRMRRESDPGITPTLHAALGTIDLHGPMTIGQLTTHEHVRKPTMTRTVQALEAQGLVARTSDPLDGRVSWLQVTPEGKKLLQRARRRTDEFLARRLHGLRPEERELLSEAAGLLERLAEGDT